MNTAVLLSGGTDSVALAYWKRPGFAYTIDYGQLPAEGEIRAATVVCEALDIRHRVIRADCLQVGMGDLAGAPASKLSPISEWWPFRNQLIITLAGAAALRDGIEELMVGSIANDNQHADGRADFFEAISRLMEVQEGSLRVTAPAIGLTAVELIRTSGIPHSLLAWSHSCHVAQYACGQCRGCAKHAETMKAVGNGDY